MASTFFDKLNELRRVLSSSASPSDQWDLIRPLLEDKDVEREFWAYLEDPHWVSVLTNKSMFSTPPSVEKSVEGSLRFQPWPASKFLARMASKAPQEVASVLSTIETDNPAVLGDVVEAALQMPPEVAARLVPTVAHAARSGMLAFSLKNIVDLSVRLGEDGYFRDSIELAGALFDPLPLQSREWVNQHGLYWYREGLERIVPALAHRAGTMLLPEMCDWLEATIEITERPDANSGDDYSCIWRPAIEEHEQNSEYQISAVLVGFVRQAFETAIRADQLSLAEALALLDRYSFLVFKRLRMYLIGEFAEQAPDLFRQTALDRDAFEDHHFKHEYAVLIGKRFDLLTDSERAQWFDWIDGGPDIKNYDEKFRGWHGREPTEQERKDRREYWQFEKLHLIRSHLAGEHLIFYQRMLDNNGEPTMADLNVRSGPIRTGNESPFTVEQLATEPFAQTVEKVASWHGERDAFEGPDLEGLASAFEQYVATNPVAFSADAKLMIGKPAIFVRGFIRKISDAISTGQAIDIDSVLKLCDWVIDRPVHERTTSGDQRAAMVDKDWQWTRDEISRLIECVCKANRGDAPVYPLSFYRNELWELLESLYRDPARSYIVHDASQDDPRTHDFLDIAINSARGKAVETGLEYARWVANHIKVKEGKREIVPNGLDSMPEVKAMLEWQLASENRTVEALAIIGSRIPLLNWIDRSWLGANAARIFDLPEIERNPHGAAGWAAWNAFLVWISPHIDFYKLFKAQYAYAVQQCATVPLAEKSRHHPINHLGEHLMLLYGRGQLGLDDDGGLLRTFLETAHGDVRRHALGFVGQTLEQGEAVPQAILDRFMWLWDFYWSSVGRKDAEQRPDAWLFGPWFISEAFPTDWALSRLEDFVQGAGVPEPDHSVAEQLAKLAPGDPARAVRILDHMVRKDQEGWKFYGWRASANQILRLAIDAGGEAGAIAVDLIDHLGRRGYVELGELLPR